LAKDIIIPIGGIHPPQPTNQCSLCKKTVSPSRLTRCPRCKKLFCKSCITEDLREGEYLICLNCARRYVSPRAKAFKSKYMPLTLFLTRKAKWKTWLKLQFSQIEGLIGAELPESAHKNVGWWTKKGSAHSKAWSSIGWSIKEVNLKEKIVIFTRPELLNKEDKAKKLSQNARLPEYKPRKRKRPSLTKIAIAQARLKNSTRKSSAMKKYRGKFRPRSAYEKRLWSSYEKL
jgi:hypothetical protein